MQKVDYNYKLSKYLKHVDRLAIAYRPIVHTYVYTYINPIPITFSQLHNKISF